MLSAQSPQVQQLFPPQPTGYVTDVAGVVDPASEARMTDLIERLRAATGAEIAVVTLPTIGNREASEVALAIGRAWGVGAKAELGDPRRNAGIVILLVPRTEQQRGHIRIEVGDGLEGIVTDAAAGRIRDLITPQLSRGEYGPALVTGVEALVALVARGFGLTDSALTNARPLAPPGGGGGAPLGGLLPLILLFVFFMIASGAFSGRRRRRRVYWGGPWIGGGWGGGGGVGWRMGGGSLAVVEDSAGSVAAVDSAGAVPAGDSDARRSRSGGEAFSRRDRYRSRLELQRGAVRLGRSR